MERDAVEFFRRLLGLQKVQPTIDLIHGWLKEQDGVGKQNTLKDEQIVIFAIHKDVIEGLRSGLCALGYKAKTLYGRTSDRNREARIKQFQNGKLQILVCNIMAAGTAITLTKARHVIFVEQDWVPGNNAQALMRVHRIGQDRKVFCKIMSVRDSVDQKINYLLKTKTRDLLRVFDENDLQEAREKLKNAGVLD